MKDRLKIAVLQQRAEYRACERNADTVIEMLEQTSKNGADILLLPEAFLTGYQLPITNQEALTQNSESILRVCEAAKYYRTGALLTAFTKGEQKPRNTALLIDRQGEIILQYHKVHTCDFSEESCLESGTSFEVCEFEGVTIGVMICYDREYPESARVLMLKGAEIILMPNDCCDMRPRLNVLETRAYENMLGIVMANPPGVGAGCSCAYHPYAWEKDGMQLFAAGETEEGLFFVEYDLNRLRDYRSREMMGNTFRKVSAYGELLSAEVKPPFIRKSLKETKNIL